MSLPGDQQSPARNRTDRATFSRPVAAAPATPIQGSEAPAAAQSGEPDASSPGFGARLLAALSYLAAFGLIVFIARPGRRFAYLHSRIGFALHVARLIWVGGILAVWATIDPQGDTSYTTSQWLSDAGLLLVVGVPRPAALPSDALPWIIWPLVVTWAGSLAGVYLSLAGRTADFHAFTHADWSNVVAPWARRGLSEEEERRQARIARDRHVERLQRSTLMMGAERTRRERMTEIEARIERLHAEQEHLNQLLSLGEISQRRYHGFSTDIEAEIDELRAEYNDLASRTPSPRRSEISRVSRLERAPESGVETIAIVTPSGVPLFTYGAFQLDEALVAGILSAFDSISEEVFGSRVHKTELAGGKVLHFAHGQHVVILAIFTEEPSPRQIEQLRTMLKHFESANAGPLARQQYDPKYLHEVHPPFDIRQRVAHE